MIHIAEKYMINVKYYLTIIKKKIKTINLHIENILNFIKFFEITDLTKELIDDLIYKLNSLFKGKDIKIIEMKKGSLDIVIALNFLIQEGLNKLNIHDITIDILFQQLTEI